MCHPKSNSGTLPRRNKNLIRILESFVILPAIALSMPFGGFFGTVKSDINTIPQIVLAQDIDENVGLPAMKKAAEDKAKILEAQAKAIDAYFGARGMPLKGTGLKMAQEADKNEIDWRLMPAIAVRESTGGKYACKSVPNSFFGWGSCKIGFKSKDEAIESLARNLSGNNPNTDHHYTKGKTTKEILQKYNPPSIIPNYAGEVMAIMDAMGAKDLGKTETSVTTVTT